MTERMTMNRVIHNAVRRDFGRLDSALAEPRAAEPTRAYDLQRAYAQLHQQLSHHHQQEDQLVFPALGRLGIDTTLIGEMEHEHAALTRTAAAMEGYAAAPSAESAAAARESVLSTRQVVDTHLAHEEGELDPL